MVGPFLLASPLVAVGICALIYGPRKTGRQIKFTESRDLTERAVAFAQTDRGRRVVVRTYEWDPEVANFLPCVELRGVQLFLNLTGWRDLTWPERDFALAREVYLLETRGNPWKPTIIASFVFFGEGVVASLNPWLILPLHAISLVYFFKWASKFVARHEEAKDAGGLAKTGDFEGALAWIERYYVDRPYAKQELQRRVARLREAYAAMAKAELTS